MVARASSIRTQVRREQAAAKASVKGLKPTHRGVRLIRLRKIRIRA